MRDIRARRVWHDSVGRHDVQIDLGLSPNAAGRCAEPAADFGKPDQPIDRDTRADVRRLALKTGPETVPVWVIPAIFRGIAAFGKVLNSRGFIGLIGGAIATGIREN